MLISDLFEARGGLQQVYHWTNAENLREILSSDCINIGASTHKLGGKTLQGVSLSRNPFLDLSNTYAVSGRRAWRIGLDYAKLRQKMRVMPIRDEYLRKQPAGVPVKQRNSLGLLGPSYTEMVSSDECEEFALGDIEPLSRFITSIGYEDHWMDFTVDPKELREDPDYFDDEYDYDANDIYMLWSLVQSKHPEYMAWHTKKYPKFRAQLCDAVTIPEIICINRSYGSQKSFEQANAYVLEAIHRNQAKAA